LSVVLPESKHHKNILLQMDEQQLLLKKIIDQNF
jgi:hypothetical protein